MAKDVTGTLIVNPCPAEMSLIFFIHLKLKLLTQFPALNDKNMTTSIYEK